MKIAFVINMFDLRGTCVAAYDYAYYLKKLYNHNSVFIANISTVHKEDKKVVKKFSELSSVKYYTYDIDECTHDCDLVYIIKYGKNDSIVSKKVKTVIHCVFDLSEPHGDVYAAVSSTLASKFGKTEFVPHMIGLCPSETKENMRKQLGIPQDAVVFGRHGGQDTFDLAFVKSAITNVVHNNSNVYFIFVNTPKFYDHPNIIHIDSIVDLNEKNKFICSCDAMIHAQSLGETFGIAIGEFSVNNKPIITFGGPVWNDNHRKILGDRALLYHDEDECYNLLSTFDPKMYECKDNNCYSDYSPKKVTKQFVDVFINSKK